MSDLSLFNGYGGFAISAVMAGIKLGTVYSSEIDPYAIKAAQLLHPKTIQLGDILNWRNWNINWKELKRITAGSPCQGFSKAGEKGGTKAILNGEEIIVSDRETYIDMKGKGAEFLSQSYLFWEFVLLLDHAREQNPDVLFMLENVQMVPANAEMISKALGVSPVNINAELVTAQNRERMFWCNFPIEQPKQNHIVISDIVVKGDYELRPCVLREKMGAGVCHHIGNATDLGNNKSMNRVYAVSGKAPTLTTMGGGHREPKIIHSYNPPLYRKAVMREMMRIQGLPERVIDVLINSGISPTQLKKMIGNGWPLPVIAHILSGMPND